MNTKQLRPFLLTLIITALVITGLVATVRAQSDTQAIGHAVAQTGPGFTFQGQLQANGAPVNDSCDIRATLWDAASSGLQIGSTQTVNDVAVANGRFTITLNANEEFGTAAFNGQERWLQIGVRCPAGSGSYTTLQPRQPLMAAPYAQSLLPGAFISGSIGTGTNALLSLSNLNTNGVGLRVFNTGLDGVFVDRAGRDGIYIGHAEEDGIFVCTAGSTNGCTPDSSRNGLEVGSAAEHGVLVNNTGVNGVEINNAGKYGVSINGYGEDGLNICATSPCIDFAENNGIEVHDPASIGIVIDNVDGRGLLVYQSTIGVEARSSLYAGYFSGAVEITGGCTGCTLVNFGVNTSDISLKPGDVVALTGSRISQADGVPLLLDVTKAEGQNGVIGVVMGRAEEMAMENPHPDQTGRMIVPREGAAQPGQLVSIITYGLVPVRVDTLSTPLTVGQRLTAGDNGNARSLQTVEVNGVTLNEAAPVLGIALEAGDTDGDGMVWMLVNPN